MGEHFGPEVTRRATRHRVTERTPGGAGIPFPTSAKMGSANHPASRGARERDAGEDYLESPPKAAGVRVRRHPARRRGRAAAPRDRTAPSGPSAAALLGVSAARAGLRHAGAAALRVRAPVGPRRVLRLRLAARAVRTVWRTGGGDSLGRGQAPA